MTRKRILFGLLVVILAGLLGWWLRELVRKIIVVPVLYVAWLFDLIYHVIPHWIFWAIFLVIAYITALNSYRRSLVRAKERQPVRVFHGERRVSVLTRWVESSYRVFYRHRLNQALTDLAVEIQALRQHVSAHDYKNALRRGEEQLPEPHRPYLQAGLYPWYASGERRLPWLTALLGPISQAKYYLDEASQVVAYLEDQLEVESDH